MIVHSGIYIIKNLINNKNYVGSTKNFENRWKHHLSNLKNGTHCNIKLQRSFDKHGENNFAFKILEYYTYNKTIIEREQYWINFLNSKNKGFNIGDASFGDTLTHHPNKEIIKQNISKGLKNTFSKMSANERQKKFGKFGIKNGMFGRPHTEKSKLLIIDALKKFKTIHGHGSGFGRKFSEEHRKKISNFAKTRIGPKNSFFGKFHSKKTKDKIGAKHLNKTPSNAKKISVDGVEYLHRRCASEATGIKQNTLSWRANSKNFPNVFWVK